MSKLSMFFDALLPNRAWLQRMLSSRTRGYRITYLLVRVGLAIVLVLVVLLLNLQQHPAAK